MRANFKLLTIAQQFIRRGYEFRIVDSRYCDIVVKSMSVSVSFKYRYIQDQFKLFVNTLVILIETG